MTRSGRYAWPPPVDAVGCIDVYRHGEHVGGSDPYMTNGRWDDDPDLEWTWAGDVPDVDFVAVYPWPDLPGEVRARCPWLRADPLVAVVPEQALDGVRLLWRHLERCKLEDGRVVYVGGVG